MEALVRRSHRSAASRLRDGRGAEMRFRPLHGQAPVVRSWLETAMKKLLLRWAPIACALAALLAAPACVGNSKADCSPGSACECSGIGNCERTCTGRGCNFTCSGTGNCALSCPQGGCKVVATGQGNARLDCPGGHCGFVCKQTGNCVLASCKEGCELTCAGMGNCTQE
jgi:hypothetical protein